MSPLIQTTDGPSKTVTATYAGLSLTKTRLDPYSAPQLRPPLLKAGIPLRTNELNQVTEPVSSTSKRCLAV